MSGLLFIDPLSPWDRPAFVIAAEDWMSAIRRPPKPPGWEASKGTCRFCGDSITEFNGTRDVLNTRKRWHAWPEHPCVHLWHIANDPAYARLQVWLRDFGTCSYCGTDIKGAPPAGVTWEDVREDLKAVKPTSSSWVSVPLGAWETEHEYPLWLVDRTAPDALKYWLMGNLKTCCIKCHQEKTAREAGVRAKVKRIEASGGLRKKKLNAKEKRLAKWAALKSP